MKRLARVEDNSDAIQWLKEQIKSEKPIVWVGYGLSYALAQTLADIFQQMGILSFALTPLEAKDLKIKAQIGYISRSGKNLVDADFIVTQEGTDISWTDAPCLSIPDVDNGKDPWLALNYTEQTLFTIGYALNLTLPQKPHEDNFIYNHEFEVLVLNRHVKPIQFLFQACNDKLDNSSLVAIAYDEIGHGFHFKLWKQPHKYTLHLCIRPNEEALWTPLCNWVEMMQIPIRQISLDKNLPIQSQAIENFCIALRIVRSLARQKNLPSIQKPLPENFDKLR